MPDPRYLSIASAPGYGRCVHLGLEVLDDEAHAVLLVAPGDEAAASRMRHAAGHTAVAPHPNVYPTIGVVELDSGPVLAAPYLSGETLRAAITRAGRLPAAIAARIVADAAAGVHALHSAATGTPCFGAVGAESIFIEDGGTALIQDALVLHDATTPLRTPEQLIGGREAATRQSDVYLLGLVLYEALTGMAPFTDEPDFERAVITSELCLELDCIPECLRPIIARATARKAADRFATADALRAELDTAMGEPVSDEIIAIYLEELFHDDHARRERAARIDSALVGFAARVRPAAIPAPAVDEAPAVAEPPAAPMPDEAEPAAAPPTGALDDKPIVIHRADSADADVAAPAMVEPEPADDTHARPRDAGAAGFLLAPDDGAPPAPPVTAGDPHDATIGAKPESLTTVPVPLPSPNFDWEEPRGPDPKTAVTDPQPGSRTRAFALTLCAIVGIGAIGFALQLGHARVASAGPAHNPSDSAPAAAAVPQTAVAATAPDSAAAPAPTPAPTPAPAAQATAAAPSPMSATTASAAVGAKDEPARAAPPVSAAAASARRVSAPAPRAAPSAPMHAAPAATRRNAFTTGTGNRFEIETTPPVDVTIDGQPAGRSPTSVVLGPGAHQIALSDHELGIETERTLQASRQGGRLTYRLGKGAIGLTGPAGSTIYVDGRYVGQIPLSRDLDVWEGAHRILVDMDGTKWTQGFSIRDGERMRFQVGIESRTLAGD